MAKQSLIDKRILELMARDKKSRGGLTFQTTRSKREADSDALRSTRKVPRKRKNIAPPRILADNTSEVAS